jgi:hypothetical protein
VAGDREAGSSVHFVQPAVELVVGKGFNLAAAVADKVMVVVFAVGVERLEARRAGADVDPLHEAAPHELFEGSVNARGASAATFCPELIEDLRPVRQHCWRPSNSITARRAPP